MNVNSLQKMVWVVGTFDTKMVELNYIAQCLREQGIACRTVDVSTSQPIDRGADMDAASVAAYHPNGAAAVYTGERGSAVTAMAHALCLCVLANQPSLAGLMGAGGSGAAALVSPAMQALPIGMPKLLVTTMAAGDVKPYVGTSDIFMLYPVTDVSGINSISATVLANAAHAMVGMTKFDKPRLTISKPAIALTMFGVTTPCVQAVTDALSEDFECIVFHATGAGGRAMEKLAASGFLQAVLDITTTEIADELVGGELSAGPDRLDAIAKAGVPYVGSLGAIDIVNFWALDTVPEKFRHRKLHQHNQNVTLMRTNVCESAAIGKWIAQKLNNMTGSVRMLVPSGGFSALDVPGGDFWQPDANMALTVALQNLFEHSPTHRLSIHPYHINSPEFCLALVDALRAVLRHP